MISVFFVSLFMTFFIVRFFGYMIFIIGIVSFIFVLGPLTQAEAKYRIDRVFGVKRTVANTESSFAIRNSLTANIN